MKRDSIFPDAKRHGSRRGTDHTTKLKSDQDPSRQKDATFARSKKKADCANDGSLKVILSMKSTSGRFLKE